MLGFGMFSIVGMTGDALGSDFGTKMTVAFTGFRLRSKGGIRYRIFFTLAHATQVSGPDLGRAIKTAQKRCSLRRRPSRSAAERPKKRPPQSAWRPKKPSIN